MGRSADLETPAAMVSDQARREHSSAHKFPRVKNLRIQDSNEWESIENATYARLAVHQRVRSASGRRGTCFAFGYLLVYGARAEPRGISRSGRGATDVYNGLCDDQRRSASRPPSSFSSSISTRTCQAASRLRSHRPSSRRILTPSAGASAMMRFLRIVRETSNAHFVRVEPRILR